MKRAEVRERYRKARHAYAQRRYYYKKKYGIDIGEAPTVPKTITEASVRRVKQQGNKRAIKALEKIAKTGKPLKKAVIPGAPNITDIVWDEVIRMLNAVPLTMGKDQTFYNPTSLKHGGRRLSEINATKILEILNAARAKYGKEETVRRLYNAFGGRIKYELERLAYAVYDKDYSRWGGGRFTAALAELRSIFA